MYNHSSFVSHVWYVWYARLIYFSLFVFQDEKKVQRVNELLDMNVQLKEARKNFDLNDTANVP